MTSASYPALTRSSPRSSARPRCSPRRPLVAHGSTTSSGSTKIAGEPADRRACSLATRGRVSVPVAGPLAMLRPLDEEPWALREAPRGGPNGHRSRRQTTTFDATVAACRRREWPRTCHRFQLATGVAQAGTATLQCRQRSTTSSTKRSGKTAMKSALMRASIQVSGPEPEATTFSQIGP